jgi:amino acid adenylation domain-containing protein
VPEIESMIGLFINVLPVRVRVRSEESIGPYLKNLQQHQSEARQYEYSPLAKVQGWSEVRGAALFETLVTFENYPIDEAISRQIASKIEIRDIQTFETSTYPLAIIVVPGEELVLSLSYTRQIFDTQVIETLLGRLIVVLEAMADGSRQSIGCLPLLTAAEREQVLREWNRTESERQPRCAHELVEDQVERTPGRIAVVCGGESLSYEELNRRARRVAHSLIQLGAGPEVPVAICLERSAEMLVAMFGIWKAGGAYVPLEPNQPVERLRGILKESAAPVLVTGKRLLAGRPVLEADGIEVLIIDELFPAPGERPDQCEPERGARPENTAYILYTSGSTGQPKGVMVQHGSVENYLRCCLENYPLAEGCGSVWHTSVAFDLSVTSLWTPLVSGKAVYIVKGEGSGVEGLRQILEGEGEGFSVLKLSPAHLTMLMSVGGGRRLRTGALVVGGEALSGAAVRGWREAQGWTRIFNEYGPTEATVGCCVYEVGRECEGEWVPIGRPLGNFRSYVLDEGMEPVGVGMKGELYIGGAGLARGYLKRADLTAERFVPDPYGVAGDRLYRTGDQVRWRADGELEYLGRIDQQVKLRGYRVELGEIEAALVGQESVAQAVVVLREDRPGDQRLVAYVTPRESITSHELREALQERLPDYMLPSAYVLLDSMPLTRHGKIDRSALMAPAAERLSDANSRSIKRTPTEELLTQIWEQVLGVNHVGIDDDFFELGGHSLLATQIAFRISDAFHLDVSLRLILDGRTIAQLSRRIEIMIRGDNKEEIPAVSQAPRSHLMPVSYSQQRLWFLDHLEVGFRGGPYSWASQRRGVGERGERNRASS